MGLTLDEFINDLVYSREMIDTFLDESQSNWAVYDERIGYVLKSSVMKDGLDNNQGKSGDRYIDFPDLCRFPI